MMGIFNSYYVQLDIKFNPKYITFFHLLKRNDHFLYGKNYIVDFLENRILESMCLYLGNPSFYAKKKLSQGNS